MGEQPVWAIVKALQALPEDTTVVNCLTDNVTAQWGVVVRSKEFSPVAEGEVIPNIEMRFDGVKKEVVATTTRTFKDALKDL